ncbi:MAG TPA: hypothetical protein VFI22_19595, partial [Thermomicrobiales bacterium]|nr:hypothetical protein [Thermomicrobiales bacterium]
MVVSVAMLLGSCDYRTRRDYGAVRSLAGPYEVDGFEQWAGVTAFFGIVALALLWAIAARLPRGCCVDRGGLRIATVFAFLTAMCFAIAAAVAGRYWQEVLAERDVVSYAMHIAPGLPLVTAGTIGVVMCSIILAFLL